MEEYNGDLILADEKIAQGLDWTDETTVPVAGESLTFGYGLLEERVRQRVQDALPLEEFREYKSEETSDAHERLLELQRKAPDLSEDEREEMMELLEEVDPENEARDSLGDEAMNALMDAGKHAFRPTEDDVNDLLAAPPDVQQRFFDGEIPSTLDADVAREALTEYWQERMEGQPFPIKFTLGQLAYMETMSVLGNGFQTEST